MRAGDLREFLTLLRPVVPQTVGLDGDFPEEFEAVASVWGAVEPLTGEEFYLAQQVQAGVTHKVTIRWRDDVRATWKVRLVKDGREFFLSQPLSTRERRRDLVMTARESFQ